MGSRKIKKSQFFRNILIVPTLDLTNCEEKSSIPQDTVRTLFQVSPVPPRQPNRPDRCLDNLDPVLP